MAPRRRVDGMGVGGVMDPQTLLDAVTIGDVVGLLAAVGAIWAAIKWIRPALRAITNFLDDWNGEAERPGVPGRAGVLEQIADLRSDVDLAKTLARDAAESASDAAFHSKPNHGSSSYDALMRQLQDTKGAIIESQQDRQSLHAHMSELSERLRAVEGRPGLDDDEEN